MQWQKQWVFKRIKRLCWNARFAAPEKLLCDNGSTFTLENIAALTDILGVKRIFTRVTLENGMGERFNRTLMKELRARILIDTKDWDSHVAEICYAYNTNVHTQNESIWSYVGISSAGTGSILWSLNVLFCLTSSKGRKNFWSAALLRFLLYPYVQR